MKCTARTVRGINDSHRLLYKYYWATHQNKVSHKLQAASIMMTVPGVASWPTEPVDLLWWRLWLRTWVCQWRPGGSVFLPGPHIVSATCWTLPAHSPVWPDCRQVEKCMKCYLYCVPVFLNNHSVYSLITQFILTLWGTAGHSAFWRAPDCFLPIYHWFTYIRL